MRDVADPGKMKILVVTIVYVMATLAIVALAFSCFRSARQVAKADSERLDSWLATAPQQVTDIWVFPMLRGYTGPSTVERPFKILDRQQVVRVFEYLRSRQSRSRFLGSFEHWGSIRYARLEVHVSDGPPFVFGVSWHSTGAVCGFGLLRDPQTRQYDNGEIIDVGASADLAREINDLVDANQLKWVPAYDTKWDTSSTDSQVYQSINGSPAQ